MPSLNLRLSDELHGALVGRAARARRSLNSEIVVRLEASLGARGPEAAGAADPLPVESAVAGVSQADAVAPVVQATAARKSASRAPSDGSCPGDAPSGTRCKICRQVHA
jgi:hypothetical protein